MAKGRAEQSHQEQQGTPTYIILSVLFAIVLFALEGIKDTISISGSDWLTRSTSLGFIALGLSICFFWRRLHDSLFKILTAFFFTASLWAYLVATIALPLLASGEDVTTRQQLIHQFGLGGIVIAGFSLMAALLYHQKPVPALLLTSFAGLFVGFGSLWPLVKTGVIPHTNEFAIENHGARGSKKVAINEDEAEEDSHAAKAAGAGHAQIEEEEEIEANPGDHESKAKTSKTAHENRVAKAHEEPIAGDHGTAKKSKMKLSAKDYDSLKKTEPKHEAEHGDDDEERMRKALRSADHEDEHQSIEQPVPRTLTESQKAKLERTVTKPSPMKKSASAHSPSKTPGTLLAKASSHGPHWEYSGEEGPQNWGELADNFKLCSSGLEQSPINISAEWAARDAIQLDYKLSNFQVIDNGHTVQVNVERGNYANIDGQRYELKQFHFHTPSEHLLDNRSYLMEVHFVHANEKGELAVIGAFIGTGKSHPEYQRVWDYMPVKTNEPIKPYNKTLDLRRLLPERLQAFHYAGSLTTPPCSEKVNWNVLQAALRFSTDQIDRFKAKYPLNARPVQSLNYRKVP